MTGIYISNTSISQK